MEENVNQYDSEGDKHGIWEEYYDNDKLRYRYNYVHGKSHGLWVTYYIGGNLAWSTNYVLGERKGLRVEYYPDGSIYKKEYFI